MRVVVDTGVLLQVVFRLIIQLTYDTIQPGFEEGATCGVLLSSASKTHGMEEVRDHDGSGSFGLG